MRYNNGFKILVLAGLSISLVGCSGLTKWVNGDDDYRTKQAELSKQLELPPNFVLRPAADPLLNIDFAGRADTEFSSLPSVVLEGLRVESNLYQRWLVLEDVNPQQAWLAIEQFLTSQGFELDEKRPDLGLVTTKYKARTEIAPVEQELGRISRLLNSWRPELVKGIYDRFSVQLVSQQNQIEVYFYHHMMTADSSADTTRWTMRAYEPMMETLALYRAMLFFGAQQNLALNQIETSTFFQEIYEGEEFGGLILNAPLSMAWDYLQTMQYRANWQVTSSNSAQHEIWLKTPKISNESQGFLQRLLGRASQPGLVKIKLNSTQDDAQKTTLTLSAEADSRPMTAEQRRQIFQALGLIKE